MKSSVTIIGAGASGLLSALVLSKHYDDVLLIDRFWPDEKGASQGTPQSCHLHVLLAEGQRLLASLLPEVWQQLTATPLPEVDWGKETWWKTPQGLLAPNDCGVKTHLFSRQRLNQVLWSVCQQQKNIRTLTAAVGNWHIADGKIKHLQFKDGSSLQITGQVIDARGRSSDLQRQFKLNSLEVRNKYRYFSIRIQPQDWQTNLSVKQVYIQACPKKQPIGLVLSPIEGQNMILTLIDTTKTLKTDEQKEWIVKRLFEENNLGSIHCNLKNWIPYANLDNKRVIIKRYRWPKNLLAIGDSICYQNPVYGQGLTIILKQLDVLKPQEKRNWLNQKRVHRCNWFPWLMASQQDKLNSKGTLAQRLLEKILQQAVVDPSVGKIFIKIMHHKLSPLRLLNPKLLAKIIRKQNYD